MVLDLVTPVICLVCLAWAMRAHVRGESHIAARCAATISLSLTADFAYRAYHGVFSPTVAIALAAFAVTMISIAIAQGRFHAPPR